MTQDLVALSSTWIDMLRDGDASGYDGDRSRAAMALAVAFVNAGLTFNDWYHELTDPRKPCGIVVPHGQEWKTSK